VTKAVPKSYSIDSLDQKIKDLQANASNGNYQAQLRLETISRLLDPCLYFHESDVHRILIKGYSLQVERGLQLYRMMSRLKIFCEPIGNKVGITCRVKLINFEELSLSKLLDIKGQAFHLVSRAGDRNKLKKFDGLALLSDEEKALYERLKPYFGGKKKPTLKSLAVNLLGEEHEFFSERNATNYLAAVREFKSKHKDDLGYRWYVMESVELYNLHAKTGREVASKVARSIRDIRIEAIIPRIGFDFAQVARGIMGEATSALDGLKIMADSLKTITDGHKYMAKTFFSMGKSIPRINFAEVIPFSHRTVITKVGPKSN
jgi:hypothetical protein